MWWRRNSLNSIRCRWHKYWGQEMTLVLGQIEPDIAFLVGDTLLTSRLTIKGDEGPVNGEVHALKIHILDCGEIAIAYAGDVVTALSCIGALKALIESGANIDPAIALHEELKKVAQHPDKYSDFLILEIGDGRRRLTKIDRTGATQIGFGYIGDGDEYARLRELQLSRPYTSLTEMLIQQPDGSFLATPFSETAGEKSFAEISLAMESLVNTRTSETTGAICGCVTRVVDARISRKLEYLQSKEASRTPWEGVSGFHYLAANSGRRGIGIYYESGNIGFLMPSGGEVSCYKVSADSVEKFIELAFVRYGLSLQ